VALVVGRGAARRRRFSCCAIVRHPCVAIRQGGARALLLASVVGGMTMTVTSSIVSSRRFDVLSNEIPLDGTPLTNSI